MEILFVIDSLDDLDKKIELFNQTFEAKFKFFVDSKIATKVMKNKFVMSNIVSIYSGDAAETIEKYVKQSNYLPEETVVYYSSAEIDKHLLDDMLLKITKRPKMVFIKKTFSWWDKVKFYFYSLIIKWLFGSVDEYASVKLQYINKNLMKAAVETRFMNRVFSVENAEIVELDKQKVKSHYLKLDFSKYHILNAIIFCLVLIAYIVLEAFFKLQFWVYLLMLISILSIVICEIIFISKEMFDKRLKK